MSRDTHQIAKLNSWGDDPENRDQPVEEELSIFSNTQFYDMDMGRSTNIATTVDELLMQQEKQIQYPSKGKSLPEWQGHGTAQQGSSDGRIGVSRQGPVSGPSSAGPFPPMDFGDLQEFSLASELPVFNYYYDQDRPDGSVHTGPEPVPQLGLYHPQPQPAAAQPQTQAQQIPERQLNAEHTAVAPSGAVGAAGRAETHSADDSESQPRQVLEEDKRKRNTAASARFRIKKKLKEQEMERTSRQMQGRIEELEGRVRQLELENKWLKNLVVERNDARDMTDIEDLRSRMLGSETK